MWSMTVVPEVGSSAASDGRARLVLRADGPGFQDACRAECDHNIAISDAPPAQYWSKYAERFDQVTLAKMMQWHALPEQWWTMSYEHFLAARRPLIAGVIRQGHQKLAGTTA